LDRTGIILAGGVSSRFGQDKGLLNLAGKPLVERVLNAVDGIVDEKLVIVSSKVQEDKYSKTLNGKAKTLVDFTRVHGPLVGALTGFREANGKYSLVLPCDLPFVSKEILSLLLEICVNRNAAIPRWPNCYTEPLQAVYNTTSALKAAQESLSEGNVDMQAMVDKLRGVRYVSTLVLQQLDPLLRTFFNVNTPVDLQKAERMLERQERTEPAKM
jgi:molybdopterin-guanine dinucleotide biosynthesis protein A